MSAIRLISESFSSDFHKILIEADATGFFNVMYWEVSPFISGRTLKHYVTVDLTEYQDFASAVYDAYLKMEEMSGLMLMYKEL